MGPNALYFQAQLKRLVGRIAPNHNLPWPLKPAVRPPPMLLICHAVHHIKSRSSVFWDNDLPWPLQPAAVARQLVLQCRPLKMPSHLSHHHIASIRSTNDQMTSYDDKASAS